MLFILPQLALGQQPVGCFDDYDKEAGNETFLVLEGCIAIGEPALWLVGTPRKGERLIHDEVGIALERIGDEQIELFPDLRKRNRERHAEHGRMPLAQDGEIAVVVDADEIRARRNEHGLGCAEREIDHRLQALGPRLD